MKLFEKHRFEELKLKSKRKVLLYFVFLGITVCVCSVFAIFHKQIGSLAAQLFVTILTAFYGCFSVYFRQAHILSKRINALYEKAVSEDGKLVEGTLVKVDEKTTTVNGLTFTALTVTADKTERCLYVLSGKPLPEKKAGDNFSCKAAGNVITEYLD